MATSSKQMDKCDEEVSINSKHRTTLSTDGFLNVDSKLTLASVGNMSEQLSASEAKLCEQNRIIEDLREQVTIAQTQAALNKADFEEERRDRTKAHSKFADLETQAAITKSHFKQEKAKYEQHIASLQQDLSAVKIQLETLVQELAHFEKYGKRKADQIKELTEDKFKLKNGMAKTEALFEEEREVYKKKLAHLAVQVQKVTKEKIQLEKELTKCKKDITKLDDLKEKAERSRAAVSIKQLKGEIEQLNAQIKEVVAEKLKIETEFMHSEARAKQLDDVYKQCHQENVHLMSQLSEVSKTSESLTQENAQLHARMHLLEGRFQTLQADRDDARRQLQTHGKVGDELDPFRLYFQGPLPASRQVGSGCYGTVYAVEVDGVQCIAKRVQDILLGEGGQEDVGGDQRRAMQLKFRQECILLSKIRHPNIVQFMGVRYGRDMYDLTLVMERLPMDLQKCLEKCQKDKFFVPLSIRFSILLDVTYGLLHLHNRSILHRDLTAGNILLTSSMRAKIADLGVSRVVEARHSQKLSKLPGAVAYMPPEALKDSAEYNLKLDVFSFGVLALFVALQEFPEFSWEYVPDYVVAKGEAELYKRRKWISTIGEQHFLYPLIHQCLQDNSVVRPTTMELNVMIKQLSDKFPRQFKDINRMIGQLCKLGMSDILMN